MCLKLELNFAKMHLKDMLSASEKKVSLFKYEELVPAQKEENSTNTGCHVSFADKFKSFLALR